MNFEIIGEIQKVELKLLPLGTQLETYNHYRKNMDMVVGVN
jgi:hypothetical protein